MCGISISGTEMGSRLLLFYCLHILVSLGNQLLPFYIWPNREYLESVSARMTALQ